MMNCVLKVKYICFKAIGCWIQLGSRTSPYMFLTVQIRIRTSILTPRNLKYSTEAHRYVEGSFYWKLRTEVVYSKKTIHLHDVLLAPNYLLKWCYKILLISPNELFLWVLIIIFISLLFLFLHFFQ